MPLLSLPYTLEETCPIPWSTSAESQLHGDYPSADIKEETEQEFVIRRYLETLWLPESFNPVSVLVHSLRRVTQENTSVPHPHPLHTYLEPLLLSARASSEKYRTELVQILSDGGGAGEQEEMMMWYAWEYEKAAPDEKCRGEQREIDEVKWRKSWLERLERREAMIQILLHMLKLSLPGPKPFSVPNTVRSKQKKGTAEEREEETEEERVESYMDKLAVWQLTSSVEDLTADMGASSSKGNTKEERHWTQVFCEDVVEPLFKSELPSLCGLFRFKVFPDFFFSDDDSLSDVDGKATNPNIRRQDPAHRSFSRSASTISLKRSDSISLSAKLDPILGTSSSLQRSRSRSLSVSLALDEENQRSKIIQSRGGLSREVSMSRVFKEKPKATKQKLKEKPKEVAKEKTEQTKREKGRNVGVTLIASTPAKRRKCEVLDR